MKKYLLIPLFIFFFSQTAFAGWTDVGSDVYINGFVGINDSSPDYPLEINSTSNGVNLLISTTDSVNYLQFQNDYSGYGGSADGTTFGVNSADAYFFNRENGAFIIGTNDTARVWVGNTGNVGINDTTPSYDLDVNGDINFTGDLYKNGTLVVFGDSLLSPQMEYALQFFGLFFIFLSLIQFIIRLSRYLL